MQASNELDGLLGLDTATSDSAVAVVRGSEVVYEGSVAAEPEGRPRHASALLAEVAGAVEAAGGWPRIGLIAVGVGPGMYTGLRVGIATARALAQARGLPIAAVSSLAALARGFDGPAEAPRLPLIDARRGEVFGALCAADGAIAWPPFVVEPVELARRLAQLPVPPLAGGDGSLRFRKQLEAAGVDVLSAADPGHRTAARHVCALATATTPGRPEQVQPIYLRRPDAEVWRERRKRDPGADRR